MAVVTVGNIDGADTAAPLDQEKKMAETSFWGLRLMFGVAVLGAGSIGLIVLLAPALAERYIFAGSTAVTPYLRILGALWLALGAVAVLGLTAPLKFSPILLVQLVYKAAWLLVAAYPALLAGNREPGLLFMTALFTAWVAALIFVVPFSYLLAR